MVLLYVSLVFFFKQKTAYELRISDWSSDVCSSDLGAADDVARLEPLDAAELEGEVDEGVLVGQHGLAGDVEVALELLGPQLGVLVDEGAEQIGRAHV